MAAINRYLNRIRAHEDGTRTIALQAGEQGYVQPRPASGDQPAVEAVFRAPNISEKREAIYNLAVMSKSLIDKVSK